MYVGSQELMKRYDQCLLDLGYSIEELVDKASDCLLKHMRDYDHIALICGIGNNGADGLSLAIKLKQLNKDIHVFVFTGNTSRAHNAYLNLCYENNIPIMIINDNTIDEAIDMLNQYQVIVDAMFGFGLNSSPKGLYQAIIEAINALIDKEVIAVDIPTGLSCQSGYPYQAVVCATKTITLSAYKNGFLNPDSRLFTGQIILEKLDVEDVYDKAGLYELVKLNKIRYILKDRLFDGHKGHYGHIGMITGCTSYKGASFLSTKAAVYSGSGVVTTISVSEVISPLTIYCPEATTMLRPPILQSEDLMKFNALLIGSGLGLDLDAYRYVNDVLSLTKQPIVIDGDALTIVSKDLELLNQDRDIILTPHLGEFNRLCNYNEDDDLLLIAREFALKYHITLVLKGPFTIVTDGNEAYRICAGNKAMSIGGMGDVLAGMITSFLGQGYSCIDAAILGVFIHGYCGDLLAEKQYSVIPSQIIDMIPIAMKKIKSS